MGQGTEAAISAKLMSHGNNEQAQMNRFEDCSGVWLASRKRHHLELT